MVKKCYRLLLALLLTVWSLDVCSQNADITASELIADGRWFELKRHFDTHKDSMSAPLRDYAKAWVYSALGTC